MRATATALALAALTALTGATWTAGCTGLSGDCQLNLTCPHSGSGGSSSSSSSSGGPDGGTSCKGVFVAGTCNTCLETTCCPEVADCKNDPNCLTCLNAQVPNNPACNGTATQKVYNALIGCLDLHCSMACVAKDTCNPVTNNGCGTDGSTCDLGGNPGTFQCYPPPNTAQLCGACNAAKGPYCAPGLRCYAATQTCARYCCADADCGTGKCVLDPMVAFGVTPAIATDKVGVCVSMAAADGGSASPTCDAPATSPSKGSCVGGFPPM